VEEFESDWDKEEPSKEVEQSNEKLQKFR